MQPPTSCVAPDNGKAWLINCISPVITRNLSGRIDASHIKSESENKLLIPALRNLFQLPRFSLYAPFAQPGDVTAGFIQTFNMSA